MTKLLLGSFMAVMITCSLAAQVGSITTSTASKQCMLLPTPPYGD